MRLVGHSTSIGEHGIDSRQLRLERVRARLSFLSRGRRCEFGGFQLLARVRGDLSISARSLRAAEASACAREAASAASAFAFAVAASAAVTASRSGSISGTRRLNLGTRLRGAASAGGPPREPLLPLASRTPTRLEIVSISPSRRFLSASMPFPFFTARVSFSCVSACFFSAASSAAAKPRAFRRRLRLLQRALEISDARVVLRRRRLRGLGVHGAFVLEFGDARFKRVLTSLDVCERCAKMLRLSLGGVYSGGFLAVPRSRVRVLLREPSVRRSQRSLRRRARVPAAAAFASAA